MMIINNKINNINITVFAIIFLFNINIYAAVSLDPSPTQTSRSFGPKAREIFAKREEILLKEPILSMANNKTDQLGYNDVKKYLASKRKEIARLSGTSGAELFGEFRIAATMLQTSFHPNEDEILYRIWGKQISDMLTTKKLPGDTKLKVLHQDKIGKTQENFSFNCDIELSKCAWKMQLEECPDIRRHKVEELRSINQLGRISIKKLIVLDNGSKHRLSTIHGFIHIPNPDKNEVNFTDYDSYSSYSIEHSPIQLRTHLEKNAYINWKEAMDGNPTRSSENFLINTAGVFWYQTHAIEYIRGSEAITKWLVELTARHHRHTLVYPHDYNFRLPFALSLDEFTKDFKERVKVELLP